MDNPDVPLTSEKVDTERIRKDLAKVQLDKKPVVFGKIENSPGPSKLEIGPFYSYTKGKGRALIINNLGFKEYTIGEAMLWAEAVVGSLDKTLSDEEKRQELGEYQQNKRKCFNANKQDVADLEKQLKLMGFKVNCIAPEMNTTHLTKDKVLKELEKERNAIDETTDCFVLIVTSHGSAGDNIACSGGNIPVTEIVEMFDRENCASLKNKPKLFFIQACRGRRKDTDGTNMLATPARFELPITADVLIGQATERDYVAWVYPNNGGVFLRDLYRVLRDKYEKMPLMAMLTMVANNVAQRKENQRMVEEGYLQMPNISSNLRFELFFGDVVGTSGD